MFTPPPSPFPSPELKFPQNDDQPILEAEKLECQEEQAPIASSSMKRRIGRRLKWTAILAPLTLMFITLSTRYITHPAAFDVLLGHEPTPDWHTLTSKASDWRPHKRHPQDTGSDSSESTSDIAFQTSSGSSTSSSASVAATAQSVPTIPSTEPVLPTPFPQAWDSDVGQSYSTQACFDFFMNMTTQPEFRRCRPFSLLVGTSDAFMAAQSNLTEMNAILWGTCNAPQGFDECSANMSWFAEELQNACRQDLEDGNALAQEALTALQAFPLMYQSGCLSDPTTNTYCYINALHNSNPSDLYVYHLPLGLALPNSSQPTCSACTKSLMSLFVDTLDSEEGDEEKYQQLRETYERAAELASDSCGADYARVSVGSGAERIRVPSSSLSLLMMLMISWTMFAS